MQVSISSVHVLQAFAENVLLCGGGSSIPGIDAKFAAELQSVSPPSLPPAMCSCPDYMPDHTPKYSSWMGAAILSKVRNDVLLVDMSSFADIMLTVKVTLESRFT